MIGRYPAKMDDKGRLFVPAKLREALGGDFYVTIGANGSHRCLTVYTAEDFHTMENNYNALNVAKRSGASTLIFAFANRCVPDKQFRFPITTEQVRWAGLGQEVMIVGRAGQAEIWNSEEYAAFELENLSPEKLLASLEEIGL